MSDRAEITIPKFAASGLRDVWQLDLEANGFAPTPLNTLKLVLRPTAAIAVPSRILPAQ